jgi:hypothetical protein
MRMPPQINRRFAAFARACNKASIDAQTAEKLFNYRASTFVRKNLSRENL